MGLEHWEPQRGRYLLYRSQAEHSADCERYPFESIPRRVFLDTNVINLLVKQSVHVFEQERVPTHIDATSAIDIEALMHVFYIGSRANWDICASPKTLDEVCRTNDPGLREDLLSYAMEVANYGAADEDMQFARDFGRRMIDAPFAAALPDQADRELLGNAIGLGCDAFCTCDRKTIVSKRDQLRQIPLRIITPAEWWAHVKPWGALWC